MSDFDFKVTSGPYAGEYRIDLADLTGTDARDFRQAIGVTLAQVVSAGGGDLDTMAALVWLARRRTNKGLPFAAVADNMTYGNVEQTQAAEENGEKPVDEVDPTTPGGD